MVPHTNCSPCNAPLLSRTRVTYRQVAARLSQSLGPMWTCHRTPPPPPPAWPWAGAAPRTWRVVGSTMHRPAVAVVVKKPCLQALFPNLASS